MRYLVFCFLFLVLSCRKVETPPNIIFVLVDDLGWADVGFMGSTFYDTPNIDQLASNGIVYNQAYAAAAVCSPTRASILTGKYPTRTGITDWIRGRYSGVEVPSDKKNPEGYEMMHKEAVLKTPRNPYWMEHQEITLAEILGENNYSTGHIGKWHLGPSEWSPLTQGFGENKGGEDYGQPPTYFDPYERNGFSIGSLPGKSPGEYLTDREAEEAVQFITKNKNKPFYLALNHYAVHTPLMAKEDLIEKYEIKRSEMNIAWTEDDGVQARFRSRQALEIQNNSIYAAMIKSVDKSMVRIVITLKELDLFDNTIIIFYSDNGGHIVSTSNSPLRMGKGHPYEGGIRVPLMIHWPNGITESSTNNTPVHSIDLFPTLIKLTKATIPESLDLDGLDISPTFSGKEITTRSLFWHFPHYWWGTKVKPYSIILKDNWKMIHWYETGENMLFDLDTDISEKSNVSKLYPRRIETMRSELNEWLIDTSAKLPKIAE